MRRQTTTYHQLLRDGMPIDVGLREEKARRYREWWEGQRPDQTYEWETRVVTEDLIVVEGEIWNPGSTCCPMWRMEWTCPLCGKGEWDDLDYTHGMEDVWFCDLFGPAAPPLLVRGTVREE